MRGADARRPPARTRCVAGWLELGRILADAKSGALGAQRRLQAWRGRYPTHPASDALWKARAGAAVATGGQPRQVALLLPLSGAPRLPARRGARRLPRRLLTTTAARARPRVRIYDVAERDAPSAYLQAIARRQRFRRRPADARGGRSARDARGRPRDDARAQFPAGRRAGAGPLLPVRALARGRGAARRTAHRRGRHARAASTLAPQSRLGPPRQAAFAEEFAAAGGQIVDQADYLAVHRGLQRDHAAPAAHDRPARQQPAPPTRSSSSSPRSRCTGG